MNKKMLFLLNPKAGKSNVRLRLLEIVDLFVKDGYDVTVRPSQKKHEITQIIKEEGANYGLIVCSGGDGTLNETINGLMMIPDNKAKPVLGYIPSGTVNDYASSLYLPKDIIEAAYIVLVGSNYYCDVGKINDKYFAYIAAFGLFTDIPYKTPHKYKKIFGKAAYFFEAVKRKIKLKSYHLVIETENNKFEGDYVFGMVTNSRFVAGFKTIDSEKIKMDDGLLEVTLIRTPRSLKELNRTIVAFITQDINCDCIARFKVRKIKITSKAQIAWIVDGEFGGNYTEALVENKEKAIKIIANINEHKKD